MTKKILTVMSGSFRRNYDAILKFSNELNQIKEIEVLSPSVSRIINPKDEFVVLASDPKNASIKEIEDRHLESIKRADFLLVCSPDGEIGISTSFEIGYAKALGKQVYCLGDVQDKMISQYVKKIANVEELLKKINKIVIRNRKNDVAYQ